MFQSFAWPKVCRIEWTQFCSNTLIDWGGVKDWCKALGLQSSDKFQ
jgi:hypothetical protein